MEELVSPKHGRTAWWVLSVSAVLWIILALALVPWHPVPGGAPPPAPAEQMFSADYLARARAYATPIRHLAWASIAVSLLCSILLAIWSRPRHWIARWWGPWPIKVVLAVAAVSGAVWSLGVPFTILIWRRQSDAGLSTQTLAGVMRDSLLTWLIGLVVSVIVVCILLYAARRFPKNWPLAAGGALGALVIAGSWAYPVLVEPMFNHFTPLPAGALRDEVMALARQEGVHVDEVLVADASARTTTLNAYVSGFGSSRRVVLYDTLLRSTPPDEIRQVVAHELAHAKNNDVLVGTLLGAVGVFVAVGAWGWRRLALRAVTGAKRALCRPLLGIVAVGSFAVLPLQNAVSRAIETRADVVALRTTDDPDSMIRMQQQLAVRSLTDPSSPHWSQWWFGTHPSTLQRIAIAQEFARRLR